MTILKTVTAAAVALGTLTVAATPASAVVTTFAQFESIGTRGQTYWQNSGANGASGLNGSLYTTSTPTSKTPGTRQVKFSFLQPSIAPYVTDVVANYTLFATMTNTAAMVAGNQIIQSNINGSFSFLTAAPITIGLTTFATGSNLLTGSFTNASIVGQRLGTSGSFGGSGTQGLTYTYSSDFLSFDPGSSLDFQINLTAIQSALQAIPSGGDPTRALRTFRAFSTGSFSSDPAPIVTAVPEPAVWGLMIVGFGMVGLQTRRRDRNARVVA